MYYFLPLFYKFTVFWSFQGRGGIETWFIMGQLRAKVGKTRAGKAYTYQMLLSFKTSATYKKNFTSRQTTVSVVK